MTGLSCSWPPPTTADNDQLPQWALQTDSERHIARLEMQLKRATCKRDRPVPTAAVAAAAATAASPAPATALDSSDGNEDDDAELAHDGRRDSTASSYSSGSSSCASREFRTGLLTNKPRDPEWTCWSWICWLASHVSYCFSGWAEFVRT